MNRKGWKGSVTVFFSLTCILFLCLICSAAESVRVQGARAQTANITGMATFSLFGEFEKKLLEEYDIFALDGSYGTGSFKKAAVSQRLQTFASFNANPKDGLLTSWCFDPWNLELEDCEVTEYALLIERQRWLWQDIPFGIQICTRYNQAFSDEAIPLSCNPRRDLHQ